MPLQRRVMRTDWGSHDRLCSAPTALTRTLPSSLRSTASNSGIAAQSLAACRPLPCDIAVQFTKHHWTRGLVKRY